MRKIFIAIALLFIASMVFAEINIPIYCPVCKRHLYNYQKDIVKGALVEAKDFLPTDKSIPQPKESDPMVCPFDKTPLNGWEYWGSLQQFKSFKFAYNAFSLLTKDENGKWKWIPYDLPMINLNEEENDGH